METSSLEKTQNRRRERVVSLLAFALPCLIVAIVIGMQFFNHGLSELYRSHEMSGEHFTPGSKDYVELLGFSAIFFVPSGLISGIVGLACYHTFRKRNKTT